MWFAIAKPINENKPNGALATKALAHKVAHIAYL